MANKLPPATAGMTLMDVDELAVLDGGKCILQLRGVMPFLSNKYDITKHPLYKYLSDHDKKNAFDIERFLPTRLKPRAILKINNSQRNRTSQRNRQQKHS